MQVENFRRGSRAIFWFIPTTCSQSALVIPRNLLHNLELHQRHHGAWKPAASDRFLLLLRRTGNDNRGI